MSKTFATFSLCFIFLFVLLRQVNAGPTDPVTISDTALRAVIEAKLGKNSGDTITESEMNGITTDISTVNKGIENLTGLEHATGVPSITFNLENIQSLTPLADLTQLTSLSLYDNKTTLDLTPIQNLTNLETLVVQRNVFRSDAPSPITDISALNNLTKLKQLYLGGQRVSSLSVLSNKTELTELRLNDNRDGVEGSPLDISHLSNLTMLTLLDLSYCDVRDISHLSSGLTSLTRLWLSGNTALQKISTISNFTALEELELGSTNITNAGLSAVLDDLSHLRWLNLSRTPISDLSVIERLPAQTLNVLNVSQISESPTLSSDDKGRALTDITPLVSLQQAGKITEDRDYYSGNPINLLFNWHLDYDSIYTDIPALIGAGITIDYSPYVPNLQRISEEEGRGRPGTWYTFVLQAVNDGYYAGSVFATNTSFKGVPVTWTVTAPDGTETETETVTGDDGLTRISVRLGSHGEIHTAVAVVPANTPANGPTHSELQISFKATSDRDAPITPDPTLPELTVSFRDYPEAPPTDTFPLTIRFSKPVSGFQTDDISVETQLTASTGNATLQRLTTPTTAPTQTYTATVKVPTNAVGTVRLVVRAGTALTTQGQIGPVKDTASEWIAFGRELTVSFRDYPEAPPTDTFPLTVRFSKPVSGFQTDDISVETELADGTGNATLQRLTTPTTGPTRTYVAIVKVPADAVGTVRLVVRAGAALTTQGQIGPVRDTASKWIAFPELTVSFSDYPEAPPTDTFSLTIRFSEPVSGFQTNDISVETQLTDGTGNATLQGLTPATAPTQTYTATVRLPADAVGRVRLVVRAEAALTTQGQVGPFRDTASKWIAFGRELVRPRDPVSPPVDASVGSGGVSNLSIPVPPGVQFFIFNEIGNFDDDANDWIELKNLSNTPLHLSEWELRFMTTAYTETGTEKDVVSFPGFLLPAQAVLLVTNTDPSKTRLASGLNIATGARQKGAQHPYFVAPDLRLPTTPYLLILQRKVSTNGELVRTIEDMAGNYFWEMSPDGTEINPYAYTPDSTQTTAPLTEVGAWQRWRSEQPGYLAAAWTQSGYHAHIGYDRHAPTALCLGTPGYVRDPRPDQLTTRRLVFNEIRNASDDTNDWIELKNVCGTDVQLSDWEISIVLNADEDVDIVSFPDYTLPMDGVLLITNTDPSKTVIADGLNIATRARQKGGQRPYLVAHGLRLPSTPYLLILRHMGEYGERTIEDIAGNYPFTETSSDGNPEIYLLANAPRPAEPLAPLTQFGAWQRRHLKQPGYLAAAWMSSGYHAHIGYDRHAPAALCLGTPGYPYDPSPTLPVTHHLVFNKIHNAANNAGDYVDYIELKNVSDMDVRLSDWEISIVASAGEAADEDVSLVSFPNYALPAGGVLLITNTDPGETVLRDVLNIATETQQKRTQRPYLVAHALELPDTPYLLILRHARGKNGTPEAIEDVAGDYFRYDGNTEVWPLADARRPSAPAAPLSEAGTYQRKDARQPGYLATAWTANQSLPNYWYDPKAFAMQLATRRLAFNKIHNAANHTNDYIELKNISDTVVRLRDWDISMVASEGEAADQDVSIVVSFPDYTLPVGGALLITNTDPDETVIIDGLNITPHTTEAGQQTGAQHPYLVAHGLNLPSTPYLLILRHARGKNGTPEAIEDVAGNYFPIDNNIGVWPFAFTHQPSAPAAPLSEAGTYQRKDTRQPGYLATAWTVKRSPPGLSDTPNTLEGGENALFASDAHAAAVIFNPTLPDEVRISELMFKTQGPSDALPQWIELYNASPTPVDLEGWQLAIEIRPAEKHRHARLTLKSCSLPPKQTVILVTGEGKISRTLPIDRVYDLSKAHADVFSRYLKNTIIGTEGFFVELIHPTGRVVDTCGNLDGDKATDDLPTWTLPDGKTPQGHRSSLLRRFEGDVHKGTEASGWMPATETAIGVNTYYGHPTDISTPGFLHQIVPGASPRSTLSISETMFETQIRTRPLPQWIELYNPSFTHSVKLKDYQLFVETRQAGEHQQIVITLEAFDVLPNQMALLITEQGKHSQHLTDHLIYNLSQRHPKAFLRLPSRSRLLSSDGFLIQLTDDSGNVVDTVGNLDGYPSTEDTPAWTLPPSETSDGERVSLRRLYEKQIPLDGRYAEAWVSTADVPPKIITYYGHASDVGNPGYRKGTPLPVTLSSFSAAWHTDTVQITWTTESELDNAGFNILRSQTKEGEFQQINTQLIQGAGTTSERNAYTWTDTTAKPNTLYYYRIEDVSYAGEHKQLATVRIRGLVSPNGKLITRWGDVKNQQ